ncbi:hypothetical protein G6514_007727 [Epicoccum nigrum]|nr:hypothetical protein G6514_007727 [Epicoccum nigrum]
MDRDALRVEFAALVKPFEQSRNLAISTPQVDIVDIIRHLRTTHVSDIPKLADQAEELAVCYSRVLCSLVEERDAVYNMLISKVINIVTSAQESTDVDAQQDTPTSAQNAAPVKDQASESRDDRSYDEKSDDEDSEPKSTQSSEPSKSGDSHQ